ncbi:MAG: hypothetical protein JOZ57_14455 [Abitibacteriaceae bacterium]|nr:hypothetical protein [Abditibacteriaceae bacterium]
MLTQGDQTILVTMWEKPTPDKAAPQTDIQVVMLKSTPTEANTTRLPLTNKPAQPIAR